MLRKLWRVFWGMVTGFLLGTLAASILSGLLYAWVCFGKLEMQPFSVWHEAMMFCGPWLSISGVAWCVIETVISTCAPGPTKR